MLTDDELKDIQWAAMSKVGNASKNLSAAISAGLRAVAEAAVKADREDSHTVSDSELAGRIMTLLGHATNPSLEPGADPLRDRVAALLARSL